MNELMKLKALDTSMEIFQFDANTIAGILEEVYPHTHEDAVRELLRSIDRIRVIIKNGIEARTK